MNWRVRCGVGLVIVSMMAGGCADEDKAPVEVDVVDTGHVSAGDAGTDVGEEQNDTAQPDDVSSNNDEEDVLTIGDVNQPDELDHRCGNAPLTEWPLHDATSTESVSVTQEAGYRTAVIEATAGGSQAARNNPFIYFNLNTGEKVEITDRESLDSLDWDLAFKRVVIRSNGADSGPGGVTMAKIAGATFEDAAPPALSSYRDDTSFDADCEPLLDPIGNLITAVNHLNTGNVSGSGSWYDYGAGVSPIDGEIYFVNSPQNQEVYKVEILAWQSGVYTLRWAGTE